MQPRDRNIALDTLADAVQDGTSTLRLQVRGVCMRPLLEDGDWVRLRPLQGTPRRGQLVLARDGRDQLVCHRILSRQGDRWRLAGDRSFAIEAHGATSMLGEVIRIERPARHLDLSRRGALHHFLDAFFATWHDVTYRHQRGFLGRFLEALRWRLVVLRHRSLWKWG